MPHRRTCSPPPSPAIPSKKPDESPKLEGPKTDAGKGDTAAVKLTPDEIAAIKELPAAEQDQAIKQAVCPVSGDHLGEMDKPIKVTAEGRTFFLCCEGCEDELKKDPKAVIAKLDARRQEVSRRAVASRPGTARPAATPSIHFDEAGVWRSSRRLGILLPPARMRSSKPHADVSAASVGEFRIGVSPALMRTDRAPPPRS